MLDKARSLEFEPVRIHDFVRSQIRTEWYAGAQKGAVETLRSGAGNDVDQASLLIAMLRASSMPARYVKGVIELRTSQLGPMLGVTSAADIGRALAAAGIAHEPVVRGGTIDAIRIEHVFVSAYVPYGNYRGSHVDSGGKAWIPLAPAIKPHAFTASGDVLARAGIVAEAFITAWLAQPQTQLPLDGLRERAQSWLATPAGQPLLDAQLQRHVIDARPLGVLPSTLPGQLVGTVYESVDLPEADQQWLRIRLHADASASSAVSLEHRLRVSDLPGRRFTLAYQAATEADQDLINRYGSMRLTPAYLLRLRARLMLRGEPEVLSTSDWMPGTAHHLELISETPAGEIRSSQTLIAGGHVAITVGVQAGATPVASIDVPHPNDSEFASAQRLASLGLRYASNWDVSERALADLVGVTVIRPAPSIGLTLVEYQVEHLLDLPVRLVLKGVSLDAAQRPTQAIAPNNLRVREAEFLRYASVQGSALEHWIFENDWGVASISADKGLQLAAQNGIARIAQTGGVLPASVTLPAAIRDEINQQLARGWRIEALASEIALNLWRGAVWRAEDTATGASGWFIAGQYAGGATTEDPSDWPLPLDDPNSPGVNEDPGAVRFIEKVADTDYQFVEVDNESGKQLKVRVTDKRYVPVVGAVVVFRVQMGDGVVKTLGGEWSSEARMESDRDGHASVSFKPAQEIGLGREIYLGPDDEFPTFVGINRIAAHAESPPAAGAQMLAALREPFTAFATPAAVAELVTQRYPWSGLATSLPSIYRGDWLVLARDAHQNIVSNASIRLHSAVEPPSPESNCQQSDGAGMPLYFTADECDVSQVPGYGSCGTTEKTLLSSTQWTEHSAHIITGQMFGATYDYIATTSGAPPLILRLRNHCTPGGVEWVGSPAYTDIRGALIEAQQPDEALDYRRMLSFKRYQATGSNSYRLTPYDPSPPMVIQQGTLPGAGVFAPMVKEGSVVGLYSTTYQAGEQAEYQNILMHEEAIPDTIRFGVWGFYTVDFGIDEARIDPIELDEGGYANAWSLPWHWAKPPLPPQSQMPLLDVYPLERMVEIQRDGEHWASYRAGHDDEAAAIAEGAIEIPPHILRFDDVDDHTYTATIVLHHGSPAALRSDPVTLKFGRPLLERYGLSDHKSAMGKSDARSKTTQSGSGRYPSRLKMKQTLDRAADRVCYAATEFVFDLYRTATVQVLAYPTTQAGGEGSPLTLIARAEFDEGTHRHALAPFDLPWGDYRLHITAEDPYSGEEEAYNASLSNELEMMDALPLAHSIVKNVDLHDGNLGVARADVDLGGRGSGLKFTRFYSSPRPARGDFGVLGFGWHTNLESSIQLAGGCGGYLVTGAEGGAQRFIDPVSASDGSLTYRALHGYHGTLVQHSDGSFDYYSVNGTRYHFERATSGRLARLAYIADVDGNRVEYRYAVSDIDGEERVVELSDSAGRILRFTYATFEERIHLPDGTTLPSLRHSVLRSVSAPGQLTVHYAYDEDGMLVSAERSTGGDCAPGHCENYAYTDLGRSWYLVPGAQFPTSVHHGPALTKITQRGNGATDFGYTPLVLDQQVVDLGVVQIPTYGVDTQQAFDGSDWGFAYVPPNRGAAAAATAVTDGRGHVTTHRLNRYGAAEEVEDAVGTTSTEWNFTHYQPARVTDAMGRSTAYTYDAHGNTLTEQIDGGVERRWTYADPSTFAVPIKNRVQTHTDARGILDTYAYDLRGHVTSRRRHTVQESFGYNAQGDRTRHTDFNGGVSAFGFDSRGYPSSHTDPLGHTARTSFDVRGRLIAAEDANGALTGHSYDGSDRRITTGFGAGGIIRTAYANAGREQTVTDELGKVTVNRFDALGRLIEVHNALGAIRTLRYDGNGNVIRETDFRGHATVSDWDDANRLINKTEPLGRISTWTHDALGHVLSETISGPDSATRTTTYAYDHPLYFRTRITRLGGQGGDQTTTIAPDNAGNPITTTDALSRVTTRTFDAFDRVTTITEPGRVTTRSYDGNGNLLSETIGDRTRTWTYDAANHNVTALDGNGKRSTTTYYPAGQVQSRIDANGGITAYELDARNRVVGVHGPRADQSTQYSFDLVGNRIGEEHANGRVIVNSYDDLHRLKSSSDNLGTYTARDYDADDNVTAETDARNATTSYTVNALSQRTRADQPEGRSKEWTYSVHGDVLTETSAAGHTTTHQYDALGQRTQTHLPEGSGAEQPRAWTYDAVGSVRSQTDSNGITTTFGYDDLNRKISAQVDAADGGRAEVWTYDARNNPLTHTDRKGVVTTITYDKEDRVLTRSRGGSTRETNTYDGNGNVLTHTDARAITTTQTWDAANQRLTSKRSGSIDTWTYTPTNQMATHTDAAGDTTTFTHDVRSRVRTEKNAAAETRTYTLDGNGNRETIQLPNGRVWTQTFDAANRLTSVQTPEGHTTTYDWHDDDQLAEIVDANQHRVQLSSDALARISARTYPGGATFSTVFDGEGNAIEDNAPDTHITRTFDGLNRARVLNHVGAASSAAVSVRYDANANPIETSLTQNGRALAIERSYDTLDRLEHERSTVAASAGINAYAHTQRYALDGNGNRTAITDAASKVTSQTFDDFNRVKTTTTAGEGTTTNVWNKDGTLQSISRSNGTQSNYQYDRAKRVTSIAHTKAGATTLSFVYAYDPNGNRTQEIKTQSAISGQGGSVTTTVYGYDRDDRLISSDVRHQPASSTTPDERTQWTLDGVSNRKTEVVTRLSDQTITSNKTYAYSARDQLELMTDSVHQLTVAYGYDQNGNRTTRTVTKQGQPAQTTTYTFDARDRMIGAQPNAPNTANAARVDYQYDADGRQIERIETPATGTPDTTLYVYTGHTLLHEADPSNTTDGLSISDTYRHSATLDRHIAIAAGGAMTLRHYQLDTLNTPVAMTDGNGDTVNRTTYNAWGEIEEQVANGIVQAPWQLPSYNPDITGQAALLSNDGQSIGFTGYQKDAATGLYYAQARWYDPLVGNFNGMDPAFGNPNTPLSFNKYLYAHAAPTRYTDPSGRCVWDLCIAEAVVGGVIVGAGSHIIDSLWGTEEQKADALPRAMTRGAATAGLLIAPQLIAGAAVETAAIAQTSFALGRAAGPTAGMWYATTAGAPIAEGVFGAGVAIGSGSQLPMTPIGAMSSAMSPASLTSRALDAELDSMRPMIRQAGEVSLPGVVYQSVEAAESGTPAIMPVINGVARRDAATSATGFRVTVEGEASGGRGLGANQMVDRIAHEYAGAVQQANRILETNRAPVTAWERIYRRYQARGEQPPEYVRGNALQQVADDLMRQNHYAQQARILVNRQSKVDALKPLRPDVQVPTSPMTQGVIDITTPKAAPKIGKYEDPANDALINVLYEQK